MSEKKIQEKKLHTQRRHRKSEINLALFLFQNSFQGNHQDLKDVIFSDKIKKEKCQLALNARDAEGMPILINCIKGSSQQSTETDYLECIKILVSTGITLDSTDSLGRTCVHWAVLFDKVEICRYLLQQGALTNLYDHKKLSPMHIAITKHSIQMVQVLCDLGHPEILDAVDGQGKTPLCHAILESLDIFKILLAAGADHSIPMNTGKTLAAYAIEQNLSNVLLMLLKHKVNLFPNGNNQPNMIHLAAVSKEACLSLVIQHCSVADLQSRDHQGKTPLMYATQCGLNENLSLLLKAKVDSNITDLDGKTTLHYTCTNIDSICANILLSYNPSLLNQSNNMKRCAIHYAILNNNQKILRVLLDHGADTNVIDNEGHTLIHYVSEYSALDCLEELISVGLSPNVPDLHQVYPIHYAVRLEEGEQSALKLKYLRALVNIDGLKLDVVEEQGLQPIHWAVCMGFTEAIRILLIQGVDPNALCAKGDKKSALHLACSTNKLDCLELLLHQPNILVDQVNSKGYTPLMLACGISNSKFTELLLNAGANPDHQASDGKTPAHIAAANTSADFLWLLSLKKANFDVRNNIGETPIHVASLNTDEACVRFLLTRKCDVNAQRNDGLTALHIAVNSKNFQRTNFLLQNNAKCNVIYYTEENCTALDIALENGDYKCIKLLQSYGARTAHSIFSHSAMAIQHAWKQYKKKRLVTRDGVPFINNSSICTSSNASESVSVLDSKQNTSCQEELNPEVASEKSNLNISLSTLEKNLQAEDSQLNNNGNHSPAVCTNCGKFAKDWDSIFDEKNEKEFEERLARGEREIQLMRQLMRDTENLLIRVQNVNEEADFLISSKAFRKIKQANKEYLETKRKK